MKADSSRAIAVATTVGRLPFRVSDRKRPPEAPSCPGGGDLPHGGPGSDATAIQTGMTSIVEIDVLFEHHSAVVILDDVVAVEPVAVLIERVCALGARKALYSKNSLAEFLGLKVFCFADRSSQNVHRIIGREFRPLGLVAPGFGQRAGNPRHHADLDRIRGDYRLLGCKPAGG